MPVRVDVTIVVDDRALGELLVEHGLSLWIEGEGDRILFDTGAGAALAANADLLGIDIGSATSLVLSHGHYDHTGGLPSALERARGVHIYCHPSAVEPRYSIHERTARAIHMQPAAAAALKALPSERLHWVTGPVAVSASIWLTGPIPRDTSYEDAGARFFLDPAGERPDHIDDDMALWISTPEGLVVCVGCCHSGLVNTLRYVRRLSGDTRIRAVIGGFHLLAADEHRLHETAIALLSISPAMVVPCHCTGERACETLADALGGRVSPGRAGAKYRF